MTYDPPRRSTSAATGDPLEIDLVYLLVDVGFLTPNGKPTEAMSAIEKAKLLGGDW